VTECPNKIGIVVKNWSNNVSITGLMPTSQIPSSSDEDLSNCSSKACWISDFFLVMQRLLLKETNTESKNFLSEGKGKGKPKERGIPACARVKVIKF
jgi:hypothetical protein